MTSTMTSEDQKKDETILVVEDDPDIRDTYCDVLDDEGYRVITASNGQEALERLREMQRPCLILLDLMMPVMDGGEFLSILRSSTDVIATLPVVVVSAWPNEASKLREQTQGFIKKPVALSCLLDIVANFCRRCAGTASSRGTVTGRASIGGVS